MDPFTLFTGGVSVLSGGGLITANYFTMGVPSKSENKSFHWTVNGIGLTLVAIGIYLLSSL